MAITQVRAPTVTSATIGTPSASITFANGATDVFVWAVVRNATVASPTSPPTINSVAMTQVTANTATTRGMQMFWLEKADHPGNGTFTLALGSGVWTSADRLGMAISEYTTGTSLDFVSTNFVDGAATDVNLSVSGAASGDFILSACYRGGTTSYAADSGQTEYIDSAWTSGCNAVVGEDTDAVTQQDWTVTGGSGNSSALVGVYREAAAGGDIDGNADVAVTGSGTLTGSGALAGDGSVTVSASGTLTGSGALVAASTIQVDLTGTVENNDPGAMSGDGSVQVDATGTLSGVGAMAGTGDVTVTSAGTLAGSASLSGDASVSVGLSGTVTGSGALAGNATATIDATSEIRAMGALAGNALIVVGAYAIPSGGPELGPLRVTLTALTPRPAPAVLSSITPRARPVVFVSLSS